MLLHCVPGFETDLFEPGPRSECPRLLAGVLIAHEKDGPMTLLTVKNGN